MKRITFECETITPMFLFGADGKIPELRAPSIKGILRFWWRAIHGDLSLEEMRTREAIIFGGTEPKTRKSSFTIRIEDAPKLIETKKISPTPHNGDKGAKPAIKKGTKFTILFLVRETPFSDAILIQNLFLLTSILGALGNRSRRGFGAFKILNSNGIYNKEALLRIIHSINPNFDLKKSYKNREYPWIVDFEFGKKPLEKPMYYIGKQTHLVKDAERKKTGNVKTYENFIGKSNRFASPVFVSVIENKEGNILPIITQLYTANPMAKDHYRKAGLNLQVELMNKILQ